jgi:hypothetical protein
MMLAKGLTRQSGTSGGNCECHQPATSFFTILADVCTPQNVRHYKGALLAGIDDVSNSPLKINKDHCSPLYPKNTHTSQPYKNVNPKWAPSLSYFSPHHPPLSLSLILFASSLSLSLSLSLNARLPRGQDSCCRWRLHSLSLSRHGAMTAMGPSGRER